MGEEAAALFEASEPALAQADVLRVLKHDDLFAVFDPRGDFYGQLHAVGPSVGADGLFQDDTRILSHFVLRLNGEIPELLSGDIGPDNVVFSAHLTNPAFQDRRNRIVQRAKIHVLRRRLLWQRKLYEALHVQNFGGDDVTFDITFDTDADFRDVFEIRGAVRARRGEALQPCAEGNCLTLSYRGLDEHTRSTTINFSAPVAIRGGRIILPIDLKPGQSRHILLTVASDGVVEIPSRIGFFTALKGAKREARRHIQALHRVTSSNASFDAWLDRAAADLSLLITEMETGPYPYAGIPWFSVPFGRDAVMTAMQVLWINPALARGVLSFLGAVQAAESLPYQDAEPGKIMHETRKGEMAALREVPFGRYYGGVDTTPLFVMLAGAYLRRTGDIEFCRGIWPAIKAALDWIDGFGDIDADGFVEYRRSEAGGLHNQGWKDSDNSVFHQDGELATGAIALVEVQAYVVAAKRAAAEIASALDEEETTHTLNDDAQRLAATLDACFWSGPLGTYALALDGKKRPCLVRTSNAGHVLFCNAADRSRAEAVERDLMSQDLFNGWGIRTVAVDASLYNPMSYHNGTVWPHDCAIAAAGFARYGMTGSAARIFTGLFEAACRFPDFRLPELFCGFRRRAGEDPVSYPSACTPQAWASGAVFMLLQATLGIEIDGRAGVIRTRRPVLPPWLDHVTVVDLPVGSGKASIRFRRDGDTVEVTLQQAEGPVRLEKQD